MQGLSFGLTGREFQETFNTEKYVALAYQQPKGRMLQTQIEARWDEWCRIVTQAPWKTYWKKSDYWKQQCVTPADYICLEKGCGNVPLAIFSCAVWGFGIEEWLKKTGRAAKAPVREILRLQGVRDPATTIHRAHMWDSRLYRGCGMVLPSEFGYLDRWLEPMWQQICEQCALQKKEEQRRLMQQACNSSK